MAQRKHSLSECFRIQYLRSRINRSDKDSFFISVEQMILPPRQSSGGSLNRNDGGVELRLVT